MSDTETPTERGPLDPDIRAISVGMHDLAESMRDFPKQNLPPLEYIQGVIQLAKDHNVAVLLAGDVRVELRAEGRPSKPAASRKPSNP